MSAKFIAQIVIPVSCAPIQSAPKATASTASVTGQESTSERSIAALFSSLNSDHRPAEPVSDTSIPGPAAASSRSRRWPAARTMSAVPGAAPQQARHAAYRCAEGRARAVARPRADHRDERIAALTVEVPIDQTAGLHGLRAIGLPAAPGQRLLGARSEYAEANGDYEPGEHHRAAVGGRPAAEPTQPADGSPVARSRHRPGAKPLSVARAGIPRWDVELGHDANVRAGPQPVMGHSPQFDR